MQVMRGDAGKAAVLAAVIGAVAASALTGCGAGANTAAKTVTVTSTVPQIQVSTVYEPPPTPGGPSAVVDGDGTYLVGQDLAPGTYKSSGGDGGRSCYWERLSGLSGQPVDRITNGYSDGPQLVEISPSDMAFKTQGCTSWALQQ